MIKTLHWQYKYIMGTDSDIEQTKKRKLSVQIILLIIAAFLNAAVFVTSGLFSEYSVITLIICIVICIVIDAAALKLAGTYDIFTGLGRDVITSRKLIASLSKNDFKTRFAGSFLGIVWAFVQPLITVVLYWFVFQVGLKAGNTNTYPFIVYLITGLIPFFFFQDALSAGTNAFLEYSYLVKKVVFKIDILPIVKIISNFFVHLFFIAFALVICACYGYMPTFYAFQILYYILCSFALLTGLVFLTSSVVVFFRDLSQIILIVLQVLMWGTPIMWDAQAVLSPALNTVFKINPLYYIVNGYRDALLMHEGFWTHPVWTAGFWAVTFAVFVIGITMFKKLKVHFADIL